MQVFSGNLVGFETVGSNVASASTLSLPTFPVQGLRVDSYIPAAIRTQYAAVLSWLQPADRPSQYYAAQSTDGGITYTPVSDPVTGYTLKIPGYFPVGSDGRFSFTASGLVAGKRYLFVIRSGNDEGFHSTEVGSTPDSTQSDPVIVLPVDPPARPRLISWTRAWPDYNTMISLSWTAPQAGGPPDTYYVLLTVCGIGPDPPTVCPTDGTGVSYIYNISGARVSFSEQSATIYNLTAGTWYRFRVAGVNRAGAGSPSDPSDPILTASFPPAPPGLTFSSVTAAGGVTLTWGAPDGAIQYSVVRNPPLVGGAVNVTAPTTSFTDAAAPFGAAITYSVYSGDLTGTFEAVGSTITLPGPATSFRVTSAGPGTIGFSWQPDAGSTVFRVLFSRGDGTWRSAAPDVFGSTSTTVSGLPVGVTFLFKVVSRGPSTPFEPTGSLPVAAAGSPPPPPPLAVTVRRTTVTEIRLSWDPPACASDTPPTCTFPTRYKVAAASPDSSLFLTPVEVQSLGATLTGLNDSMPLIFRVILIASQFCCVLLDGVPSRYSQATMGPMRLLDNFCNKQQLLLARYLTHSFRRDSSIVGRMRSP